MPQHMSDFWRLLLGYGIMSIIKDVVSLAVSIRRLIVVTIRLRRIKRRVSASQDEFVARIEQKYRSNEMAKDYDARKFGQNIVPPPIVSKPIPGDLSDFKD